MLKENAPQVSRSTAQAGRKPLTEGQIKGTADAVTFSKESTTCKRGLALLWSSTRVPDIAARGVTRGGWVRGHLTGVGQKFVYPKLASNFRPF